MYRSPLSQRLNFTTIVINISRAFCCHRELTARNRKSENQEKTLLGGNRWEVLLRELGQSATSVLPNEPQTKQFFAESQPQQQQ